MADLETLRLFTPGEVISNRVKDLADIISFDFCFYKELTFVCIMNASFVFTADLIRHCSQTSEVIFISNIEDLLKRKRVLTSPVIVLDTIVDSGKTMVKVIDAIRGWNCEGIRTCALFCKPQNLIDIDYVGFKISSYEGFLIGYGLDLNNRYRDLPDVWTVKGVLPNGV